MHGKQHLQVRHVYISRLWTHQGSPQTVYAMQSTYTKHCKSQAFDSRAPQKCRESCRSVIFSLTSTGQVRPVVFVTARVHPGETPASFVAHGLVDWLLGSTQQAEQLRRGVTLVVLPMLNPDGVFLGNYRYHAAALVSPPCYLVFNFLFIFFFFFAPLFVAVLSVLSHSKCSATPFPESWQVFSWVLSLTQLFCMLTAAGM